MNVFLPALNASSVDASIPAYGTGFKRLSLSLSLLLAVSLERPTYHSLTIWTSFVLPLMLLG